jgi:threonine synthase
MHELGLITRLPRIACAQAQRANPLYLSYLSGFREFHAVQAQPTLASAIQIGNPVSVHKAIRTLQKFEGVVEQASENELANAAARADRTGLFTCPHTGVALAVLGKLIERGEIRSHERVVVISTANGLKFPEFKIKYHESRLADVTPHYTNLPVDLPPDYQQVRDVILRALEQRRC